MNRFENIDCMIGMKEYPDKYFNLAIVDPPYGKQYARGKNGIGQIKELNEKYENVKWDSVIPSKEYFNELFRISQNQIIWGGNYFIEHLFNTNCFVVWDKIGTIQNNMVFSDCELAWTSFKTVTRKFTFIQMGYINDRPKEEERIHPTQKPIALYKWLLTKYAKPNDKILDTHVGSASSLIACEDMGFEYVGFELDEDYFNAANKRLEQFRKQIRIEF